MPEQQEFNVGEWVRREFESQTDRIDKLAVGFARILMSRRKTEEGALDPGDLVRSASELYGSTDSLSIHTFLNEAIAAGAVLRSEVGGSERAIYKREHTSMYLLLAEGTGRLACHEGQYSIPDAPTETFASILDELRDVPLQRGFSPAHTPGSN